MLVLSRKPGEKICIGNGITVIVNRIAGGRVTLAIDAPEDVRILRGELSPHNPAAVTDAKTIPTTAGATMSTSTTTTMTSSPTPQSGVIPTAVLPPALARRAMLPPISPRPSFSDSDMNR